MVAVQRSEGVAPEVNLRNHLHTLGNLPWFQTQDRHNQKSKTEVSVVPQNGLMSSKYFFLSLSVKGILPKQHAMLNIAYPTPHHTRTTTPLRMLDLDQ